MPELVSGIGLGQGFCAFREAVAGEECGALRLVGQCRIKAKRYG